MIGGLSRGAASRCGIVKMQSKVGSVNEAPLTVIGALFFGRTLEQERWARYMAQGTVKWFNEEKGYGFITPDGGSEELFVHYSGIVGEGFRSLEEGDRVSFEAVRGKKGMQAENVSKERL